MKKERHIILQNKQILYVLLCCTLQLMLCGCVPGFRTYWAPRAEGGMLSSHGQLAASDSVDFIYDGVKVSFTGQGTFVGMGLHIPNGKSVVFSSDKAEVLIPEKRQVVFDVRRSSASPYDEGTPFNPTVSLYLPYYWARIVISDSEKTIYRIKMPNIIVNGVSYTIPEIEFTKGTQIGIFG